MEETQIDQTVSEPILDRAQLVEAVRKQVDYYFSKENLQSDPYLTSQMDAQMTVPISFVMKFAKLKALTQDESVLREALENSSNTTVVDNKIKANIKPTGRSTIILREIPSDAPEEEVRAIFAFEGCKPIGAIRSDIGDSWFVSMDSEEEAKDTLLDLRLKKRTFRGAAVKARLKTETVIRSYYPLQSAPVMPVVGGYAPMPFGAPVYGYGVPVDPSMVPLAESFGGLAVEGGSSDKPEEAAHSGKASNGAKDGKSDSRKGQAAQAGGNSRSGGNRDSNASGSRNATGGNSRAAGKATTTAAHTAAQHTRPAPVIEINSANFPPLQVDTPVPTPGYKEAYLKYSFEEVIAIVKEVKEAALPPALNPAHHHYAMTASVNMDLLRKQRTYSIDETREQLRQGRPVHREAITAGAVDYRSFMHGDDGQHAHTPTAQPAAPVAAAAKPVHHNKSRSNSHAEGAHPEGGPHQQQTPKKISASSWAAMVKSSAAATAAAETASPARVAPAAPAAKAPASAVKAAAPADKRTSTAPGKAAGERKRTSSKEPVGARGEPKKDKKKPAAAAHKEPVKEGEVAAETAAQSSDATALDETSATADAPVVAAVTAAAAAAAAASETKPAAAWGGKSSFASIVKLKTPEDEVAAAAAPTSPVRPTVSAERKPAAKPAASGARPSTGSRPAGTKTGTAPASGERKPRVPHSADGAKRERAPAPAPGSSGGASASGVWVREALPALAKK